MQKDFGLEYKVKKILGKRRRGCDDIIWFDLKEGCWKACAALMCLRIKSIGGVL